MVSDRNAGDGNVSNQHLESFAKEAEAEVPGGSAIRVLACKECNAVHVGVLGDDCTCIATLDLTLAQATIFADALTKAIMHLSATHPAPEGRQ